MIDDLTVDYEVINQELVLRLYKLRLEALFQSYPLSLMSMSSPGCKEDADMCHVIMSMSSPVYREDITMYQNTM